MNIEIIYIHSLILQVCVLLLFIYLFICQTMFMLVFLGLLFLHVWCLKLFWHFFGRQSLAACQRQIFSVDLLWIPKKARHRRHFWAFGLSLKEHCFHQFESNLKTRPSLRFQGYFIYSFVSMFSFSISIYNLFSEKTIFFIPWKPMIIYTQLYLLYFYFIFLFF